MVCYNSMSPLPLQLLLLCSTSILCSFSCSCTLTLCSTSLLPLYALCCLCMLYVAPLISTSGMYWSHSTHMHNYRKITLSSLFCMSFSPRVLLPDHHSNSSSSLVVILNLFIISGRYLEILWLLWQSQLFVFSGSYSSVIFGFFGF
jgi:hypothetical protein